MPGPCEHGPDDRNVRCLQVRPDVAQSLRDESICMAAAPERRISLCGAQLSRACTRLGRRLGKNLEGMEVHRDVAHLTGEMQVFILAECLDLSGLLLQANYAAMIILNEVHL